MGRLAWLAVALVLARPLAAQRGWDVQGQAVVLARDSVFLGGGAGVGLRFPGGLRVAATAGAGWIAPAVVGGRGEALVAYHLYPVRPAGVGWYLGGGVAGEVARGDVRGFLLAVVGAELRPWRGGGLFAELGVGGGVRAAVGYRRISLVRPR